MSGNKKVQGHFDDINMLWLASWGNFYSQGLVFIPAGTYPQDQISYK